MVSVDIPCIGLLFHMLLVCKEAWDPSSQKKKLINVNHFSDTNFSQREKYLL